MTDWPVVVLGSLIRVAGSRAGARTNLPVYSVTKHQGFVPSLEYFNKQVFSKDLSTYKVASAGDFAYATIHLDEGSIGVAKEECLISPMYTIFSTERNLVDTGYLIRYLKSPQALRAYSTLGRGTAERRRSISLETLGRIRIPLPPLPVQREIASVLDSASRLRSSRRATLSRIPELVSAAFAASLSAGARQLALSDLLVEIQSGTSPVSGSTPAAAGEWGVLKLGAVSSGSYKPGQNKALLDGTEPQSRHEVKSGDILLARKNTPELVGASAFVARTPDRLLLPDLIFRLVPKPDVVEPRYLQAALSTNQARQAIRALSGGSAASMSNVSKARLLGLTIPVAPKDAQLRFAEIVKRIEVLHELELAHLALLDELFASLQHRAFTGQL